MRHRLDHRQRALRRRQQDNADHDRRHGDVSQTFASNYDGHLPEIDSDLANNPDNLPEQIQDGMAERVRERRLVAADHHDDRTFGRADDRPQ